MSTKTKQKYNKMNQLDHVLHRPDTYVGSTRNKKVNDYISSEEDEFKIKQKVIEYSPAILRIFIEILSNAIDNHARSKKTKTPCTKIKINIDPETGETCIWNDGEAIPIEIHEEEGIYNHSLIFGHLLTSSNYDDEEERYNISGRNGIGATACNIFSKFFKVRGFDPESGKLLSQEWNDNMKKTSEPKITTPKLKKGFTEVTWIPDFTRFKKDVSGGYSKDIVSLYCKYCVDAAMLTGVDVYFNDELIPCEDTKRLCRSL